MENNLREYFNSEADTQIANAFFDIEREELNDVLDRVVKNGWGLNHIVFSAAIPFNNPTSNSELLLLMANSKREEFDEVEYDGDRWTLQLLDEDRPLKSWHYDSFLTLIERVLINDTETFSNPFIYDPIGLLGATNPIEILTVVLTEYCRIFKYNIKENYEKELFGTIEKVIERVENVIYDYERSKIDFCDDPNNLNNFIECTFPQFDPDSDLEEITNRFMERFRDLHLFIVIKYCDEKF